MLVLQISVSLWACTDSAQDFQSLNKSANYKILIENGLLLNLSEINPDVDFVRLHRFVDFDAKNNRLLIADNDTRTLHLFNMQGEHVHSIGGKGQGPEEFVNISSFGVDENGNVIVYDSSLDLIKIFDNDGVLISIHEGLLSDGLFVRSIKATAHKGEIFFSVVESRFSNQADFWKSAKVAAYDYNGNLLYLMAAHDPQVREKDRLYKFSYHGFDRSNEKFYLSQRVSYRVLAFDLGSNQPSIIFGLNSNEYKEWTEEAKMNENIEERRKKNINQSFSNVPFVCGNYFMFNFMNMTDEFYRSMDHHETDFYLSVYETDTYSYLGTYYFKNKIPLGSTKECDLIVLLDDDPDNLTISIKKLKVVGK